MKPFDLEAAKAGAKVQTRIGFPVTLFGFDFRNADYPIFGVIHNKDYDELASWADKGEYTTKPEVEHCYDLVMAPTVKTYYVHVYRGKNGNNIDLSVPSETPLAIGHGNYIKTITLEVEE